MWVFKEQCKEVKVFLGCRCVVNTAALVFFFFNAFSCNFGYFFVCLYNVLYAGICMFACVCMYLCEDAHAYVL